MDDLEYFYFLLKIKSIDRYCGSFGELWVCQGVANTVFYDTIELTEEMKVMNGRIIECYLDPTDNTTNKWVFNRLGTNRKYPGGLKLNKRGT